MSDPVIEVTVRGRTGSGKTAVMRVIQRALLEAGVPSIVKDPALAAELTETDRLAADLRTTHPVVVLVERNVPIPASLDCA